MVLVLLGVVVAVRVVDVLVVVDAVLVEVVLEDVLVLGEVNDLWGVDWGVDGVVVCLVPLILIANPIPG